MEERDAATMDVYELALEGYIGVPPEAPEDAHPAVNEDAAGAPANRRVSRGPPPRRVEYF